MVDNLFPSRLNYPAAVARCSRPWAASWRPFWASKAAERAGIPRRRCVACGAAIYRLARAPTFDITHGPRARLAAVPSLAGVLLFSLADVAGQHDAARLDLLPRGRCGLVGDVGCGMLRSVLHGVLQGMMDGTLHI